MSTEVPFQNSSKYEGVTDENHLTVEERAILHAITVIGMGATAALAVMDGDQLTRDMLGSHSEEQQREVVRAWDVIRGLTSEQANIADEVRGNIDY